MSTIRFTVPGEPVTWKRARRGRGRSYTDPKDAAHREKIRAFARNAGVRRPFAGPVALELAFYRRKADAPTALCTGDLDNLEKAVKDALSGIAYVDDRQVTDVVKRKRIDRARPRTEVTVVELEFRTAWEDASEPAAPLPAGKDLAAGGA